MTAEEILDKTFDKHKWRMVSPPYYESEEAVLDAMKEFARLKCEELLEIVAEKAKIKVEKKSQYGKSRKWQKVKEGEEFDLFDYEMRNSINKNSILNAVDLNSFIQ